MLTPEQLKADAEACRQAPSDDQLQDIASLAKKQQRLEHEVEAAERALTDLKAALAQVKERDLPDALAAVGLKTFELTDGYKVEVKDEYYANIPSPDSREPELIERRMSAFKWIRDSGNGDLIKEQIIVECPKGSEGAALAQRVINGLQKAGIPWRNIENIHWQTLRAFVKEQMTADEPTSVFPEKTFGAIKKKVAHISQPKKK